MRHGVAGKTTSGRIKAPDGRLHGGYGHPGYLAVLGVRYDSVLGGSAQLSPIALSTLVIAGHMSMKVLGLIYAIAGQSSYAAAVLAMLMWTQTFQLNNQSDGVEAPGNRSLGGWQAVWEALAPALGRSLVLAALPRSSAAFRHAT